MQNHVILLNAPPGAGKDTICKVLCGNPHNAVHMEFKRPMYQIASAMVGLTVEKFLEIYADREKKENPCEEFLGMSGRQLMIDISESFCKPRFGIEYFGRVAANGMNHEAFRRHGYAFSDSGFLNEAAPIARKFGADNVTIVQFTGQGVTEFAGDSRTWVDGTSIGIRTIRMEKSNDNISPEDFAELILQEVWQRDH